MVNESWQVIVGFLGGFVGRKFIDFLKMGQNLKMFVGKKNPYYKTIHFRPEPI
jgi:hypothetical protein